MPRKMIRTFAFSGVACVLLLASGCAKSRRVGATPSAPPKASAASQVSPLDPLAAAELRERALGLLERAAMDPNPALRANAIEGLTLAPARAQAIVSRALRDENVGVRSVAAMTVGRAPLPALAEETRALATDASPFVSCAAIFAMNKNGIGADRTPLAVALLNDPSTRVRAHAAFILGEMGEASAVAPLKDAARRPVNQASESEYRLMQLQIAEAMVKLGDSTQLNTLRAALYPSQPGELEATALAVQILGQLRDRESIPNLVYLSARRDATGRTMPAEVRLAVAAALARMGMNQGDFVADEFFADRNAALRAQAAYVYGETALSTNLGKLAKLMDDPEGVVRVAAATAVVKIGSTGLSPGGVGR